MELNFEIILTFFVDQKKKKEVHKNDTIRFIYQKIIELTAKWSDMIEN